MDDELSERIKKFKEYGLLGCLNDSPVNSDSEEEDVKKYLDIQIQEVIGVFEKFLKSKDRRGFTGVFLLDYVGKLIHGLAKKTYTDENDADIEEFIINFCDALKQLALSKPIIFLCE